MFVCNYTFSSCFLSFPQKHLLHMVFLLIFFVIMFTYFTGLFLNGFVVRLILLPSTIYGNYKYIMLINNVNNMAYKTSLVVILLYRLHNNLAYVPKGVILFHHYFTIGLFLYKLPLTLNRLIAVSAPYNYEFLLTKARCCQISFVFSLIPALLTVLHNTFKSRSPVNIIFASHIFVELFNQSLHIAVFTKLKRHLRRNTFGNMSTNDSKFRELREAIKANFLQSFIPLALQIPVALFHAVGYFYKPDSILGMLLVVITQLSAITFHISPLIDPLCIISIISAFRMEWHKMYYSKTVIFRHSVIVLMIVLQGIFAICAIKPILFVNLCAC